MNIVLVEDDLEIRAIMEDYLGTQGHRVQSFKNGVEALYYLKNNKSHLVITDFNLGVSPLNGYEILTEAQKTQFNIPVIIMTADSSVKFAVKSMMSGACEFLSKPFNLVELDTLINNVQDKIQAQNDSPECLDSIYLQKVLAVA
jgi:DNA-binding NtrC family response regulator